MKRELLIALVFAFVACPLVAQSTSQPTPASTPETTTPAEEPPKEQTAVRAEGPATAPDVAPNIFGNFVNLNLQMVGQDSNSSKFEEYRDLPEGLAGPALRVFGSGEGVMWLAGGNNLGEDDRRFYVWANTRVLEVDFLLDEIPHNLGTDAKSVEKIVSNEAQGITDYAQASLQAQLEARWANPATRNQINYAYLNSILQPLLNTPEVFDLGFTRTRAGVRLGILPNSSITTTLTVFQENRDGNRSSGTSFGFGNVVETAEPIEYRTQDVRLAMEAPLLNNKLLLRGSIGVNTFENAVDAYSFDNPFRVTDSTDASAYQAPGSGSVNGPSMGRIALPPDNNQINASVGGFFKLPMNSRITADLMLSRLSQTESLLPFTTNTAIIAAFPELGRPPSEDFDGEIDTTSLNLAFNSRPIKNLNLTARLRMYDMDNNSNRIETPGFVAFDATFQQGGRITVPYGYTNNRAEIFATYDFRLFSLEGGYRHNVMERTFRETEETTESIFHVAADLRPFSWLVWRNSFEFGDRDYDEYDQIRGESASFHEEEQVNIPGLKRFDQAKRDSQRVVSMATLTPFNGNLSLSGNYTRYFDDYAEDAEFGLQTWLAQSVTLEADWSPGSRYNLFAYYTRDEWEGFQKGRQSGASFSTNPADNWSARNSDDANTIGIGANFTFIPDKLNFHFSARRQNVDGNGDFDSPPGGTPDVAVDIANIDDTKFSTIAGELVYQLRTAWEVGLGAWFEDYEIDDALNAGTIQYLPASLFLAPNDLGYQGGSVYVRTTYRW